MIQNSTNYQVYIHRSNGEVIYVGMGLPYRPFDFRRRNKYWKRLHDKYGVSVEIYKDNLSKEQAFQLEIKLISKLKPCCNFTKGGDGGNVWGSLSLERQEEIRLKNRRSQSGSNHSQYGKPKSESTKSKIRQSKSDMFVAVRCVETGISFESISEASRETGVASYYIKRIIKGRRKSAYGLSFIAI